MPVRTRIIWSLLQMWVVPAYYFRVLDAAIWAVLGSYFMHSWFRAEWQSHLYIKGKKILQCSSVYCLPREPSVLAICQIWAGAREMQKAKPQKKQWTERSGEVAFPEHGAVGTSLCPLCTFWWTQHKAFHWKSKWNGKPSYLQRGLTEWYFFNH